MTKTEQIEELVNATIDKMKEKDLIKDFDIDKFEEFHNKFNAIFACKMVKEIAISFSNNPQNELKSDEREAIDKLLNFTKLMEDIVKLND